MWAKFKKFLERFFHRRRLIRYCIYVFLLLMLFIFRSPLLRYMGHRLIKQDELQRADVLVELGGNPHERAFMVHHLFKKGYAPRIITTGKNESVALQTLGIKMTEAENSKAGLVKRGVADSLIFTLNEGTSTMEEAEALKKYALQNKYKKMILVTSMFHTSRVHKYFNRVFKDTGIRLIVRGAWPLKYKINTWWHSEEGLLMVNNEYVKSFYYWWKY